MRWFVLNCQSLWCEVRIIKKEQVEFQCFKLWIKIKAMETFLGNSATNVSAELKWIHRKIFFQMASYRWEIAYRAYLRKNSAENQTPGNLKITKKTEYKRRKLGKSSSTAERQFLGIPSSLFFSLVSSASWTKLEIGNHTCLRMDSHSELWVWLKWINSGVENLSGQQIRAA